MAIIISILSFIPLLLSTIYCETLMLLEVTRHGARTGLVDTLKLPITKKLGNGALLPVGLRQHYLLGQEVANRYPTIFVNGTTLNTMKIYSTGVSRTLKSAIAHVIGLLNDESTKSLLKDLYVANNDHEYDPMMRMKTYVDCQALYDRGTKATSVIQKNIFRSKKVKSFSREVEWKFGLKPFRKLRDVSDVFD